MESREAFEKWAYKQHAHDYDFTTQRILGVERYVCSKTLQSWNVWQACESHYQSLLEQAREAVEFYSDPCVMQADKFDSDGNPHCSPISRDAGSRAERVLTAINAATHNQQTKGE